MLLRYGFWRIMLDEAQIVCASNSMAAVKASQLWRRHAWVVTGETPFSCFSVHRFRTLTLNPNASNIALHSTAPVSGGGSAASAAGPVAGQVESARCASTRGGFRVKSRSTEALSQRPCPHHMHSSPS